MYRKGYVQCTCWGKGTGFTSNSVLLQENSCLLKEPEKHTLLLLPKPFVVPGERFRELYYWDSYFIVLGLLVSGLVQPAMVSVEVANCDRISQVILLYLSSFCHDLTLEVQ